MTRTYKTPTSALLNGTAGEWTVVVRDGTPDACVWNRHPETFKTRKEARAIIAEYASQGVKALANTTYLWNVIGLPEGWE